jgi:hypothetical protein
MNNKDEENNNKYDPYKVKVFKTAKDDKFKHPRACQIGIFPPKLERFHSLIIGRSGSGKTNVMLHMLTDKNLLGGVFKPKNIFMFCGVKPDKGLVKELKIPKKNVITDFDDEKVLSMFASLEDVVERKGWSAAPKTLWLFDDILAKKKFLRGKALAQMASAGRHAALSFCCLSQYYKSLPPILRTNASYIIYFSANESENVKFADEQCPSFMSKKQFLKIIEHCTKEKYSFLALNTLAEKGKEVRKGFNNVVSFE